MDLKHSSARLIVAECLAEGLLRNEAAYCLATAWHESGAFKYMREIWGPTAAQRRYEGRADLGNVVAGDGRKFLGRGFCQITGRRNYTDWGRRLGLDLLKEPQLAEQPVIAAKILVQGMRLGTFTGKKLSDYIDPQHSDFVGARRIINGTDRANLIALYATQYDALLKADGYGEAAPQTAPPAPVQPVTAPQTPVTAPGAPVPYPAGPEREPQPLPAPSVSKPVAAAGIFALVVIAASSFWHQISAFVSNLF